MGQGAPPDGPCTPSLPGGLRGAAGSRPPAGSTVQSLSWSLPSPSPKLHPPHGSPLPPIPARLLPPQEVAEKPPGLRKPLLVLRAQQGEGLRRHPGTATPGSEGLQAARGPSSRRLEPPRGHGSTDRALAGLRSHVPRGGRALGRPQKLGASPPRSRSLPRGSPTRTGPAPPRPPAGLTFDGELGLLAGRPCPGPAGAGRGHGITPGLQAEGQGAQHRSRHADGAVLGPEPVPVGDLHSVGSVQGPPWKTWGSPLLLPGLSHALRVAATLTLRDRNPSSTPGAALRHHIGAPPPHHSPGAAAEHSHGDRAVAEHP